MSPEPTVRTARDLPLASDAAVRSVYVHVPFCFHKCHYCDFYSLVDTHDRQQAFVERLIAEIAAAREFVREPLETVFIGGGTPTLLRPDLWQHVLEALHEHLPTAPDAEVTVEANPETVTAELVETLASGGVNRISTGAQSFQTTHLKTLERWHDPASVARSIALWRDGGIDNINVDLIFAIPGETIDDWKADLDAALTLQPAHLSCYGLTYEPNTPMTVKLRQGRFSPVEADVEAAMYETTCETLAAAGFEHYEISNWARPGRRCQHNLAYWRSANWWPLGPSASGHVDGVRWKNLPRLGEYLAADPWPPIVDVEQLDDDGRAGEALMLGLRLIGGLPNDHFDALLTMGTRSTERQAGAAQHLAGGLLQRTRTHTRLTAAGRLLADSVLVDLL